MRKYIRLNITTEGQTEHRFVKDVLYKHLQTLNIHCEARSVLTSREFRKRGGLSTYAKAKNDILHWMRDDKSAEARFTTMFDLYALPDDFPGMQECKNQSDPYQKVKIIEQKMSDDIGDHRFRAYIQLYEFEALIFADLDKLLLEYEDRQKEVAGLKMQLAQKDSNPELINDKKETSPSHRIIKLIPEFQKVDSGSLILNLIGLESIRQKCKHFNDWLAKLEDLNQPD